MKIYFDPFDRDPVVKSETFWSHETSQNKIEYANFFSRKEEFVTVVKKIEDCDAVLIPRKWNIEKNESSKDAVQKANFLKKKVIAFFNDDFSGNVDLPGENFYLFRTSAFKSKMKNNEIVMPAFCEEFDFSEPTNFSVDNKVVGFCGNIFDPNRYEIFVELQKLNINRNFIYRKGFWAPEIEDKSIARKQFVDNLKESLFGLCIRGNGNFSYRLYETLALGRIPIIVNSDMKLPLEKSLEWREMGILLERNEVKYLHDLIHDFCLNRDLKKVCLSNKIKSDLYMSPHGMIKNIDLYLKEAET